MLSLNRNVDSKVRTELLIDHPGAIPTLESWFREEWQPYYGPEGPGNARQDLQACCNRDTLPIGLIAIDKDVVCGTAALKTESVDTHRHLSPWLAALLVDPSKRGSGIGEMLIRAIEEKAFQLGFTVVYAGAGRAATLFNRMGWLPAEQVVYYKQHITIFLREITVPPLQELQPNRTKAGEGS
jgi:GNAT superfamily N-acetyltransferase